MKTSLLALLLCLTILSYGIHGAPTVSNVVAKITRITDNGKGMKTRSFEATFDLANTNGKLCRIFPGVRGVERHPVLTDEGPYLWYKNVSGDTATIAGTGKKIAFTVTDTAGEFETVRVKITAWDRDNWPPWPNRTFNPRHHGWALDVRNAPVQAKSAGFINLLETTSKPAFLQISFDFSVFRVMGNHSKGIPSIAWYPDESDSVPVPFPSTTLGDPYNAYPEGNFTSGTCSDSGDCHIEIVDVENWTEFSMGNCYKTGATPFAWEVGSEARFPLSSDTFLYKGTGAVPGALNSPVAAYRPITWTSADAAGLDITPGLVLLDEINEGEIHHALRTCSKGSAPYFVHPASHKAGSLSDPYAAPMGLRWRLKSSFDINAKIPLTGAVGSAEYRDARAARIVLRACQKYGMINADNSGWSGGYFMGELDQHNELKWNALCAATSVSKYVQSGAISWADFEVVDWNWQYQQYVNYEARK
jgi:hypothetical protein